MQRGFAQLLLLLAIFAAAAFAGVYFYQSPKEKPSLQSPRLTEKQPELNDYSGTDLGFRFEYLKDLIVEKDSEEEFNKRGNGDFRKNFKGYVGYEPGEFLGAVAVLEKLEEYDTNPFSVWVFNNNNNLLVEQWFKDYWYYPYLWGVFDYTSKGHVTPDQEATISGQLAKYKIVSYQPNSPKYLYLSKDKKMYLFRIIGEAGDQILSSFKFLENSLEGKGYICPKNGWEDCMPIALLPGEQDTRECSQEALDWKKKNCPNFRGAAY